MQGGRLRGAVSHDAGAGRRPPGERDTAERGHHRVKNNLQIISSFLDLQAGRSQDPGARAALAESQGRMRVMALVHQLLYERNDFSRVDLGEYLERLTQIALNAYPVDPQRIALKLDMAKVYLDLERAIPCALLANELVTNAFKHAFPGAAGGEPSASP
ncbi:MAG: sensor histidine kinase [Beggiatoa sp.]|nr:sensor histidine kinase [Beggiatoa sp.]